MNSDHPFSKQKKKKIKSINIPMYITQCNEWTGD